MEALGADARRAQARSAKRVERMNPWTVLECALALPWAVPAFVVATAEECARVGATLVVEREVTARGVYWTDAAVGAVGGRYAPAGAVRPG